MNNLKLLSAAILLVLAKLAFAVMEVEPNNVSNNAAVLALEGIENVGQLNNGNDVDFYSIDASKDISLTFACNSRATAQNNNKYGWFLTVHDDAGELQSSYQVLPEECVTGTTAAKGPYNFRIPKLEAKKAGEQRKYYLSVVGDCRRPIFNVSDNPLLSINTFDKPATKSEIDKSANAFTFLQTAFVQVENATSDLNAQIDKSKAIDEAQAAINTAQLYIQNYGKDSTLLQDIAKLENEIEELKKDSTKTNDLERKQAELNDKKSKLDFALKNTILKSIALSSLADVSSINISDYLSTVTEITNNATLNVASKAQINTLKTTTTTITKILNSINSAISEISNVNKIIDAANKITPISVLEKDVANLINEINSFNNRQLDVITLNNEIENLNTTAENLNTTVLTTQDICTTGNTANYTIKDNPDTGITPYKENNIKNNLTVLGKENSGQNGSVSDVDFFELAGSENVILPIKFSCSKSNAKGNTEGWVISAWQTNEDDKGQWKLDKPAFVYQVSPADCNAEGGYPIDLKPYDKNYIVGVQSACALPPVNTETKLRPSGYANYFDYSEFDFLCDANTANFTLKRDFKTATQLAVDVPKTGEMNSRSDYDLFVVENDQVSDYVIDFSCSETIATTVDKPIWKLSVYDDADKLVPNYPQQIKATDCNKNPKQIELPSNAIRSYIAIEPVLPLDNSEYTIKKSIKKSEIISTEPEPEKLTGTDGASVLLSSIEKGKITKTTDTFNYYVDGSSLKETQLSFSCAAPEILFGNNWKVSVYKSDRTLKDAYVINSSDCVLDKTIGESAYTITIPKEASRFYLQVKSTCEDKNCKIDQSEFEIKRKIETVTSTNIEEPTAFTPFANLVTEKIVILDKLFKKRIKKANEIHFYSLASSLDNEVFVKFSCDKNTNSSGWTVAVWEYDSDEAQKAGWLYEKQTILPSDCIAKTVKIAVPSNSNSHLISVQSNCLTTPENSDSALEQIQSCNVNTSNYTLERGVIVVETPVISTPTIPVVTVDPIVTKLTSAKKITTIQKNQLNSVADIHAYYVDTGVQKATEFEFSCPDSARFTNDWTLLIYNSEKKLQSTQIINGSDCGVGKLGDNGVLKFSSLANSTRTYFVVKSACETDDSICELDTSQYQIKRIISAMTPTMNNGSSASTITSPCFSGVCTVNTSDAPVFGGN